MTFGQKMAFCRKDKRISQAEISKRAGINGDIVGKYEREEMTPSIEAVVKLAHLLDTTVAYLLGENENGQLLKGPKMMKRLQDIDKLSDEDKNGILYAIDNLLKAAKLKTI